MLLSDYDISDEIRSGAIVLDPYHEECLQPASYDVHLDDTFLIPRGQPTIPVRDYDAMPFGGYPSYNPRTDKQDVATIRGPLWLPPHGLALGCTSELLTLHPGAPIAADIAGCSSLGRWWLFVHVTAGFIDPGWSGRLTLELYNAGSWWVRVEPGMRIAQLRFYELRNRSKRSYLDTGHYAGAVRALPSAYKG